MMAHIIQQVNAWAVFYLRSLLPHFLPLSNAATCSEQIASPLPDPAGDCEIKLFLSEQAGLELFGK